jgi:multiple sugar transport system permease protein
MRDWSRHVFIWPATLIVLLVTLFPLVYTLDLSFQNVRLIPPLPPRYIGFDNYLKLLEQERFWAVISNTSTLVVVSVVIQYVLGFAIALALHSRVAGEKLYRVMFLLPMLMTPIAVALLWKTMFNSQFGPLNELFTFFGYPNPPFLTQTTWSYVSLITVEVWQWTPFVILMMLAGLQSLPTDIYEAAKLENASSFQIFWGITFPMLLPLSAAVIFIRFVEAFKIMDTVFIMTGGGPGISTETLTLFAYQEGLKKFNLGYTSAISFLFLIFIILCGITYMLLLKPQIEKRR